MDEAPGHTHFDRRFIVSLLLLIAGAFAMGASPLFVRYAADEVNSYASAFWRVALALPFLWLWATIEKRSLTDTDAPPAKKEFPVYPVLAGLAFAGDLIFWHLAILNTSVANATFFATTTPIFVIAFSYFVLRQSIGPGPLIGILICLCGGAALLGNTLSVQSDHLSGDLYGLVTALFFSLYILAIGKARKQSRFSASIILVQTLTTMIAFLAAAVVYSAMTGTGFFPNSLRGILALTGLAIISQVLGQGLLTVSMGRINPVFSSFVIFMEAIFAAFLAWVFLDERLTALQCTGGFFVLLGLWVARPRT